MRHDYIASILPNEVAQFGQIAGVERSFCRYDVRWQSIFKELLFEPSRAANGCCGLKSGPIEMCGGLQKDGFRAAGAGGVDDVQYVDHVVGWLRLSLRRDASGSILAE